MNGPTERQAQVIETLRSLAAQGGREAAVALGQLLRRPPRVGPVELLADPPSIAIPRRVAHPDREHVAVAMDVQEPLGGTLLLLVDGDEAERISQALVPEAAAGTLDTVGESAIVEVGNIAGSSFVSALARGIPGRMLHGVPRLGRGSVAACLGSLAPGARGPALALAIGEPDAGVTLLLLLDAGRLDELARLLEGPSAIG